MSNCEYNYQTSCCNDDLPEYDLCMVRATGDCTSEECIVCEGFKFTAKLSAEAKKSCSCYEAYSWKLSDIQYEWEITEPHDYDWFDKRFKKQLSDKHGMSITGYVMDDNGDWIAKETLMSCIIEETGREYGQGVSRSIKGKALKRKLNFETNYVDPVSGNGRGADELARANGLIPMQPTG